MPDPRVYFAAERTLLAWVRTGITVMALGFVVSRFALFLRLIAGRGEGSGEMHAHWMSNLLGVSLVLAGSAVIVLARQNHVAFLRRLPREDLPDVGIPWLSSALALALSILGLIMAVYLMTAS